MRPGSMNGYSYVEGNPINFNDPTGWCRDNPAGDGRPGDPCIDEINRLNSLYHVKIVVGIPRPCSAIFDVYDLLFRGFAISWTKEELGRVEDALQLTQAFLDKTHHPYIGTIGDRGYMIKRVHIPSVTDNMVTRSVNNKVWTEINDTVFENGVLDQDWSWQVHLFMHEIFHAYDFLNGYPSTNGFPEEPKLDSNTGHCIPSFWACGRQEENFTESTVSYAEEWLARNGSAKALKLVNELINDVSLVGTWMDNQTRQKWLDKYFFGQDLIWPTTLP